MVPAVGVEPIRELINPLHPKPRTHWHIDQEQNKQSTFYSQPLLPPRVILYRVLIKLLFRQIN